MIFQYSQVFQSTLPRRERLCCLDAIIQLQDFNPRSREGSDCTKLLSSKIWLNFNPRSREGSDPVRVGEATWRQRFQSTLPRRERHNHCMTFCACHKFQSTLPRRERPLPEDHFPDDAPISIHAPAKGATQKPYSHNHMNFNPRSREGSDPIIPFKKLDSTEFQSTLPRRERQLFVAVKVWYPIFQSTLPRRERLEYFDSPTVIPKISIHAPAKGATNPSPSCVASTNNFNPRSREGSDHRLANFGKSSHISIHAPAKGATPHGLAVCNLLAIFQSTLPRRERLFNSVCIIQLNIFQSTLPRRERPVGQYFQHCTQKFQSTLPRRERPIPHGFYLLSLYISIHAPAKGATHR